MTNICDLADRKCKPCEGGVPPLRKEEAENLLKQLEQGWQLADNRISRTFSFKNYYQTMAFVNAVAWVSHQEDHHPDMMVGYNQCRVEYTTHAIGGLSENDFICAAKVDMLLIS
ncbi:4a-hydroxytetrahydrobiopterin dehydratase [Nitrosomonas eutropha]|uniref:Putative pterin-4-alpha-carbinolamine dehydratase n=2 Tax=Nitrosomonas eutropha TaxID=916 RepID=PHS_NITEC|nr:4a-hydroxytetrahydrobiopterin dehydratase [Nitrosomonas eutropha]Q0ADS7.1 RecName: Full=Putative pterin-4-alpha-carbinolamine dehydratase; Short=PHS; AltName: Full=4-alpha-hydroxy-tetrahydropterin dehydratase; AltName: Full=Pterin carbinolamine dehydratase; Short=PCD [Nitrosomonas eutropha C91]ABI60505.1 pterin-4-alpha-carbinolamine dehydratase [Nitrosomonas eutropha C91]PXV79376.1 pterin-4-alpha-carbinolamine dehydratase [Nitrosomonas eutropha]SCX23168.1 pterin-4-alpha-carbinolamine dehydra